MARLMEGQVKIYNIKMIKTEMAGRPLKFAEVKNPFGSFQFNPKADAWWVLLILLSKNLNF